MQKPRRVCAMQGLDSKVPQSHRRARRAEQLTSQALCRLITWASLCQLLQSCVALRADTDERSLSLLQLEV